MIIWLDDWLLHRRSWGEHIDMLENLFLALCEESSFTLGPDEYNLIAKKAKRCGRKITDLGGTLYPRAQRAFLKCSARCISRRPSVHGGIGRPENAGDLQEFICAINCMCSGLPGYTEVFSLLQNLFRELTTKHGAKKAQ